MDFIYRMALVTFDPENETELAKHWDWILAALACSSESLHRQIGNSPYASLPRGIQNKIYKYLLRGRYRATPFGLWAGVGTGTWGKETSAKLPLAYRKIDSPAPGQSPGKESGPYRLAPGAKTYHDHVTYWNYSASGGGWRIGHLERNSIIDLLTKHLNAGKSLDFAAFRTFFRNQEAKSIDKIWQMILDSGFLIPSSFPWYAAEVPPSNSCIDLKLDSPIVLNKNVKSKLDALPNEMGAMFTPIQSPYLEDFKRWFLKNYDDRFVPISLLAHQNDFFTPPFPTTPDTPYCSELLQLLWKRSDSVDLSTCFGDKKTELSHLQIAFKVLGENDIFIENIVCNRPFAYSGRFSLDPAVKEFLSRNIDVKCPDAVLADIILFESSKSNYIARHGNMYRHSIYPFGSSRERESWLGTDDLLLGIRGNRLALYSRRLEKQVIPMVQHPINPEQISHPLSRLLWEIANQDQSRFLPYQDPVVQHSPYFPRLTWKGVTLQGQRWILKSRCFSGKTALLDFLRTSGVACPVQAGYLDRELVLDWNDPLDLAILWEELNRMKEITLYECPWKEASPFVTHDGQKLYPQVVYFRKGEKATHSPLGFLNRIDGTDSGWTYVRIGLKENHLLPFLAKSLPNLIGSIKRNFQLQSWYYLLYGSDKREIRLRLRPADTDQLQSLKSELENPLRQSGWVDSVRFEPYYPEFEKYRLGNQGILHSESLFYLESEALLLGDGNQNLPPILGWRDTARAAWIVCQYLRLIGKAGFQRQFFRYCQSLLKEIPAKERSLYRATGDLTANLPEEIPGIEPFQAIHEKLSLGSGEELLRTIPNHLHMCCNRAFPSETKTHEYRVLYGIYKQLGKSLYCRSTTL